MTWYYARISGYSAGCWRIPYRAGRRSAFYRLIVSSSFIDLSKPFSKYLTFSGPIIYFFNRTIHRKFRDDIQHYSTILPVLRYGMVLLCFAQTSIILPYPQLQNQEMLSRCAWVGRHGSTEHRTGRMLSRNVHTMGRKTRQNREQNQPGFIGRRAVCWNKIWRTIMRQQY